MALFDTSETPKEAETPPRNMDGDEPQISARHESERTQRKEAKMNTGTHTGGEIAARSPEADRADGYETRQIHPASRTERSQPDAADRADSGYDHREIAPQGQRADRRDVPPPPPQPRTCFVSFREADLAAPPCYR